MILISIAFFRLKRNAKLQLKKSVRFDELKPKQNVKKRGRKYAIRYVWIHERIIISSSYFVLFQYNLKKKDDPPATSKTQQEAKGNDLITRMDTLNAKIQKANESESEGKQGIDGEFSRCMR